MEKIEDIIIDKSISFTGHRNLHKIIIENKELKIKMIVKELCRNLVKLGYIDFISGGAEGFDWLVFDVIEELKLEYPYIHNILFIPFFQFDIKFKNKMAIKFKNMLLKADLVIFVDEILDYNKNNLNIGRIAKYKLFKRNECMVDYSNFVIGCWDGSNSGTSNAVNYSKKLNRNGIIINPDNLIIKDIKELYDGK